MVGWHHQFNGHEFEQNLGDSEGQGSLACCRPCLHKEDTTKQLNNNDNWWPSGQDLELSLPSVNPCSGNKTPQAFWPKKKKKERKSYFVNIERKQLILVKQIFDVKGITATLHFLVKEHLSVSPDYRQEDTHKQTKLPYILRYNKIIYKQPNNANEGSRNYVSNKKNYIEY